MRGLPVDSTDWCWNDVLEVALWLAWASAAVWVGRIG